MKQLKYLSFGLVLIFGVMSFMTKNNFNPNGKDLLGLESNEMVKVQEIKDLVMERIGTPVANCISEVNPHVFMMKCYSTIEFKFMQDLLNSDSNAEVYANTFYRGQLTFIECDNHHHLADIDVNYATKEIKIQESYFSPVMSESEFLKSFCEKIKSKKE